MNRKGIFLLFACRIFLISILSSLTFSYSESNKSFYPASITDKTEKETVVIRITLGDAILMAIKNNPSVKIERINPAIRETYYLQEKAVFDPIFSANLSLNRQHSTSVSKITGKETETTDGWTKLQASISKFLPSGTEISAGLSFQNDWSDLYSDSFSTRVGFSVTHSLLQGSGIDFNLASVNQAKIDLLSSRYELRGFVESLVCDVEKAYWNYALAQKQIEIYQKSLDIANQQLKEVEERISSGTLAEIEIAAAQAEVALRQESLIDAYSNLESARLRLLQLLNPSDKEFWKFQVILKNLPAIPEVNLDDVESHIAVAMKMRPDLHQALLSMKKQELEIVKTKNGLLPKMDLFISLGKTGYSKSFGGSLQNIGGNNYDISTGVIYSLPIGNRSAREKDIRARLTKKQIEYSIENLKQLIELDVRLAYIEVERNQQKIQSTYATRRFQEEKLRAETEKFRVGRSTGLFVAQAQRDLLSSQISEVKAVVNYLNSLVELFYLEGSLLERRGISTDFTMVQQE